MEKKEKEFMRSIKSDSAVFEMVFKNNPFYRFLRNTSVQDGTFKPSVLFSKLCAIGYLSINYKDPECLRAVWCIGPELSGKSLFLQFIQHVTTCRYHSRIYKPDRILKTYGGEKVCILDDPPLIFNVELFYNDISTTTLSRPKFVFATKHGPAYCDQSMQGRIWFLPFYDFYNKNHHPKDDFDYPLFESWTRDEWIQFHEFICYCVLAYCEYGYIEDLRFLD